jgi:hypothetical protein
MMNISLHSNRSYLAIRLAFWRFMAYLAEHAIKHKSKIQALIPFIPLLGYGTLAYILGWGIGEIVTNLIS